MTGSLPGRLANSSVLTKPARQAILRSLGNPCFDKLDQAGAGNLPKFAPVYERACSAKRLSLGGERQGAEDRQRD